MNPESDDSDAGTGAQSNSSGESNVFDHDTISNKTDRERELSRERSRKYRERHKKRGKLVESGKTRQTNTRDTTSKNKPSRMMLDLTDFLFSVHMMCSSLLTIPSLSITENESEQLATAINRVIELFEIPMLDEKTRAWINLGMVGVRVYGTRVTAAIVERKKEPPAPQPLIISPSYMDTATYHDERHA